MKENVREMCPTAEAESANREKYPTTSDLSQHEYFPDFRIHSFVKMYSDTLYVS